jgi:hypothetical protein
LWYGGDVVLGVLIVLGARSLASGAALDLATVAYML